jgi:hypothetical protein
MATWLAVGRHIGLAAIAGVISGVVVGGLLGRVAMRISGLAAGPNMVGVHTSNGNRVGDITFGGTLGLVVFVGIASGLLGGIVYAAIEPWLRRLRPWHGLAYGIGLLATFGFTVLDPFNFDFGRFGPLSLNIVMFSTLFVLFGVSVAWLFDRLGALDARSGATTRVIGLLVWPAMGFGVLAAVSALLAVDERDRVFFFASAGALALAALVHWRGLPQRIGYASLGAVLLLGAVRTFDAIQLFRGF